MDDPKTFLFDAIIALETREECQNFLDDLLTPGELAEVANRLQMAYFLHKGLTQREVARQLKVAVASVNRANHVLKIWVQRISDGYWEDREKVKNEEGKCKQRSK